MSVRCSNSYAAPPRTHSAIAGLPPTADPLILDVVVSRWENPPALSVGNQSAGLLSP
jgi:hypothetical protein